MAQQVQQMLRSTSKNILGLRAFSTKCGGSDIHSNKLHVAVQREYPKAEPLPLPQNIQNETARFSPLRSRDINGSAIVVHDIINDIINDIDVTTEQQKEIVSREVKFESDHLNCYDQQSPVNLASTMQSTVPYPFEPPTNDVMYSSYLSFPGGGWGQQTKYLSHELNASHFTELRQEMRSDWSTYKGCMSSNNFMSNWNVHLLCANRNYTNIPKRFLYIGHVHFNNSKTDTTDVKPETGRAKLKKAFKEYGVTVVVFHVTISLISLGICYTLVSSGLDVCALLEKVNLLDNMPKLAENTTTFLLAYAVHKIFAPARISITLFSTPFIVKYLRKRNILK